MGDDHKTVVKDIGTFRLFLKIGFYLDLIETFVALSFRPNLISFLFWTNLVMLLRLEIISLVSHIIQMLLVTII